MESDVTLGVACELPLLALVVWCVSQSSCHVPGPQTKQQAVRRRASGVRTGASSVGDMQRRCAVRNVAR